MCFFLGAFYFVQCSDELSGFDPTASPMSGRCLSLCLASACLCHTQSVPPLLFLFPSFSTTILCRSLAHRVQIQIFIIPHQRRLLESCFGLFVSLRPVCRMLNVKLRKMFGPIFVDIPWRWKNRKRAKKRTPKNLVQIRSKGADPAIWAF